ncbi:YlcG family protein, partial [Salmonella enterica subsp. enterica serovar Enteritidis]|nr:YlcG family protein [Salmonella enterica subsp. enterica serovar Enteritidis]
HSPASPGAVVLIPFPGSILIDYRILKNYVKITGGTV